jgi:hypothetical protein
MRGAAWWMVGLMTFGLAACSGINLDPTTHREFPREENSLVVPPADLQEK